MSLSISKYKAKLFLRKMVAMSPGVIVSMFIFGTIPLFLGRKNALLGICAVFICKLNKQNFTHKSYGVFSIRMFFLTILASLALQNLYVSLILNFIIPIYAVYFWSNEFIPRRFFNYGFLFIILQAYPITLKELPVRILALIYTLGIIYIYFSISSYLKKRKVKREEELEMSKIGLFSLASRLHHLMESEEYETYFNPILSLTNQFSMKLYQNSLKHGGLLSIKDTAYFQLLLFIEEANQLINKAYESKDKAVSEDHLYIQELTSLFKLVGTNIKLNGNHELIEQIEIFTRNHRLSGVYFNKDWLYVLEKLKKILTALDESKGINDQKISKRDIKEFRTFRRKQHLKGMNFNNSHFRFAVRMGVVIFISFLIVHFIPPTLSRRYWLPISAYSILYPYFEEQKKMIWIQAVGAIGGIIFFGLVFQFVPISARIIFAAIAYTFFYSVQNQYMQKIAITGISLVLTFPYTGKLAAVEMRFGFLFLALILVWLAQKFILPIDSHRGMVHHIIKLLEIDTSILQMIKKSMLDQEVTPFFNELLLKSYLLTNEIMIRERLQTKYTGNPIKDSFIERNRTFIFETKQLLNVSKEVGEHQHKEIVELLDEIAQSLKKTTGLFQETMVGYHEEVKTTHPRESFHEDTYVYHRLKVCMESTAAVQESIHINKQFLLKN